jgi:hypothetical protein
MLSEKMVLMAAGDKLITSKGDGWKVKVLLHVAPSPELAYFKDPHLHRSRPFPLFATQTTTVSAWVPSNLTLSRPSDST